MPKTAWALSSSACLALLFACSCALTIPAQSKELVSYKIADGAISKSLTGTKGDPANGRKVVIDSKRGGCLSCHKIPIPEEQFHGEVGPDLADVASRLSEGQMRLRLVDAKHVNPETFMPAFYKIAGLHRVQKKFKGKTILTAQEVEDVVAYLKTLKTP
ncbi:MAG: sulfur oxidation c-type cytochrome SoxX [Alphaproteobacteria bacterium]